MSNGVIYLYMLIFPIYPGNKSLMKTKVWPPSSEQQGGPRSVGLKCSSSTPRSVGSSVFKRGAT